MTAAMGKNSNHRSHQKNFKDSVFRQNGRSSHFQNSYILWSKEVVTEQHIANAYNTKDHQLVSERMAEKIGCQKRKRKNCL